MPTDPASGFLQSILANPDDDTPRLVFADWLEEHSSQESDRARAQFLRLQCELARLPERDPNRARLQEQCNDLLAGSSEVPPPPGSRKKKPTCVANSAAWSEGLPAWVSYSAFQRGFPARVDLDDEAILSFLRAPEELWQKVPVEALRLLGHGLYPGRPAWTDIQERLSQPIDLGRLRALDVSNLPEELAVLVLAQESLAGLRELQLGDGDGRLGDPAFQTLALNRQITSLRKIDLCGDFCDEGTSSRAGPAAMAALAGAAHLGSLRELNLTRNRVANAGALALSRSPYLRNLEILKVYDCDIGNAGVRALAGSPVLQTVNHLEISCDVNIWSGRAEVWEGNCDAGLLALARSPWLGALRELHFTGSSASTESILALARSQRIPQSARVRIDFDFRELEPEAYERARDNMALARERLGNLAGRVTVQTL